MVAGKTSELPVTRTQQRTEAKFDTRDGVFGHVCNERRTNDDDERQETFPEICRSVQSADFHEFHTSLIRTSLTQMLNYADKVLSYFVLLSLSHSVIPTRHIREMICEYDNDSRCT